MVLKATWYGSPFIHNLDEGRRYCATIEDFQNFREADPHEPVSGFHHGGGTPG